MGAARRKWSAWCRVPYGPAISDLAFVELRPVSVMLQVFGAGAWLLSVPLAPVPALLMTLASLQALCGIVGGIVLASLAPSAFWHAIGSGLTTCSLAYAFNGNLSVASQPMFWVLPVGLAITLPMAPIFNGVREYLVSATLVWWILSDGQRSILLRQPEAAWIVLVVAIGLIVGYILSSMFARMRKRNFDMHQQLTVMAYRDELTGLDNRRRLLTLARAAHAGPATALYFMMIDIDDFKHINDGFGHDVGDQVLRQVAGLIGQHAGACPHGRLGGEEFGLMVAGSAERACALAAALVAAVRGAPLAGRGVSISVGIAAMDQAVPIEQSWKLADDALYLAKRAGKNCYRMAAG